MDTASPEEVAEIEDHIARQRPRMDRATIDAAIETLKSSDSEEQHMVALIQLFAANVFMNEAVDKNVFEEIAQRLFDCVVFKCPLNETLPLPWQPRSLPSKAERDLAMNEDIADAIDSGMGTIEAIQLFADRYSVGFETAKKAYYDLPKEAFIEKSKQIVEAIEKRCGPDL